MGENYNLKETLKVIPIYSILFYSLILLTVVTSCRNKGCRNINALNFDSKAVREDGSCEFLMLKSISVTSIASVNSDSVSWDEDSRPDLQLVFTRTSDAEDKRSTKVSFNAVAPVDVSLEDEVIFSNEKWNYFLYDYDVPGPGALIDTGSFNPIKDQSNNEIIIAHSSASLKFMLGIKGKDE